MPPVRIPHLMMVHHATAVFLGPSLGLREACDLLEAQYLPPARKGDIYRIMTSGVKTIVLVDGVFHNTPSVWPREILDALEDGIQVFGAASMGALRAAELHPFGMQGYGTIFEWYRDGVIEGDDEVAVSHASAEFGFRPLSEALVNIRFTVNRALQEGVLSREQADQLLEYVKRLYYPERSYQKLLDSEVVRGWPAYDEATIRTYFRTNAVNLKRSDTIGVLRHAARYKPKRAVTSGGACHSGDDLWQLDRLRLTGFVRADDIVNGETVLQAARKIPGLLTSMRRKLSQRCFVLEWARQANIAVEDDYVAQYSRRWEEQQGMDVGGEWLRANGLTRNIYQKLLRERALIDWMVVKGPAHFKLLGNFQQTPAVGTKLGVPRGWVLETPLPDREHDDAAAVWIDMAYRGLLLEWARQNGICCPSGALDAYRDEWSCKHAFNPREATPTENRAWIEDSALVEWITTQGPNHFGILWAFEDALLRELQVTGGAAILLQKGQSA
jgi:hypothetical protein